MAVEGESVFSTAFCRDDAKTPQLCKVCGDHASGNHFGVLSCEACKSFFRRSVRVSSQYACRGARNCPVTAKTRNRCPFCRLQKCLAVGMRVQVVHEEKPPVQIPSNHHYQAPPAVFVPSYPIPTANMQSFHFLSQNPAQPPLQFFTVPHLVQTTMPQSAVILADPPSPQASSSQSDSGLSSVASDADSHKGSAICNSTLPPELATSNGTEEPDPSTSPPKDNITQEEIMQKVAEHTPGQRQTHAKDFLSGPDIPLAELDLDWLIATHQETQTPPPVTKDAGEGGLSMPSLMSGAKHTLGSFVKWVRMIDTFCQLPKEDRLRCVKGCWTEQMILSLVYRSLILQSGKLVTSSGTAFQAEDMQHELVAYTISRVMGEVMGTFKALELDHKEFVCLRLLLLFSPDGSGLEGDVKAHVQRIQDQILILLEDYCTMKAPNSPQRYSKLLLAMASMRSIGQEAVQELEVQKAMKNAQMDVTQAFSQLDI